MICPPTTVSSATFLCVKWNQLRPIYRIWWSPGITRRPTIIRISLTDSRCPPIPPTTTSSTGENTGGSRRDKMSAGIFSFDLGYAHFVAISTEYYGYFYDYGMQPIFIQYDWLRNDLQVGRIWSIDKLSYTPFHTWVVS